MDDSRPISRAWATVPDEVALEVESLALAGKVVAAMARLRAGSTYSLAECTEMILARWSERARQPEMPCPYCGQPLKSPLAKQCFQCGLDWHDDDNVVRRGSAG